MRPGLRAVELLRAPPLRAALVLPVLTTVLLVLTTGELRDPVLFVVLLAAGAALVVAALLQPPLARLPGSWDRDAVWALLAGGVGPGLVAALLTWAVVVDVRPFAPLFAMVMLVNGFVAPRRIRVPVMAWIVLLWLVLVVGNGERDPAVLLLHLGGGVALLTTTMRAADALTVGYARATEARVAAERHTELLSSLLRTHDLDPAVVLRSAAEGLLGLGFDLAAVREVDREAGVARLLEGVARADLELPAVIPLDDPEVAEVLATGRACRVHHGGSGADGSVGGDLLGIVLYPVVAREGEVVAIVAAGTVDRRLTPEAERAAEVLVAQAGEALLRARAYRADQRTTAELQRLERRTQDFLSTVSHELRTPLTVVQGLGATLSERWEELSPARRSDLLHRVDGNAERLATMVTRLLDTSQVSRSELPVHTSEVALAPLLRTAVERIDAVLAEHRVTVEIDEQLRVLVDPALFEHVIDNLLVNIASHTPAGTAARLSAWQDGERIVVELTDDGPGIAPDDLPHLLDRFYRGGDEAHRVSTRGLGLGLALAAEVVSSHGGTLEVGTAATGGARFTFDVPAAAPR
ncbi:MAG: sensor histidine kinase [Actinomycetota bacterium]